MENNQNAYCAKCRKPITADEAAITKKLINRGTRTFYCIGCLAEFFDITQEDIREKIAYYKKIGCTLFP